MRGREPEGRQPHPPKLKYLNEFLEFLSGRPEWQLAWQGGHFPGLSPIVDIATLETA
jgi:hypothetical protein